jgi:hypothetical protein
MHKAGCQTTDLPFFWCPRCGTFRLCDGDNHAPAVIDRLRQFEEFLVGHSTKALYEWKRLGIAESIRPGRIA